MAQPSTHSSALMSRYTPSVVWQARNARFKKGKPLNQRQKSQVKRIINYGRELKFFQYATNNALISSTGTVDAVFAPIQGDTDSERSGDQTTYSHFECRMNFFPSGVTTNLLRIVVFQWHPNSTPTTSSIFLTGASGVIDVTSMYSHDNRQEYRILYDRFYPLVGGTGSETGMNTRYFRISGKKVAKRCQFSAGGTTSTNKIYICYISDQPTNKPSVNVVIKTYYYDS